MERIVGGFLSLAIFAMSIGVASSATAQTTLDRLDNQIRTQGQGGATPSPPAAGSPTTDAKPAGADRAYFGAIVDDRLDRGRGVRILSVRPGGPAAQAGLRPQDLIVNIAGNRIRQTSDLQASLDVASPGDRMSVEVVRDTRQQKVDVTLGRPPVAASLLNPGGAEPIPGPGALGERPLAMPGGNGAPLSTLPRNPAAPAGSYEQLQQRVDQLERRVEELERALGQPRK